MAKSFGMLAVAGVIFGSTVSAQVEPVVLNVNMSAQQAEGTFNPGNGDLVLDAGNWNNWATTNIPMVLSSTPNVYTVTQYLTLGSYPQYKFIISNSAGLNWEQLANGYNRYTATAVPAGGTNVPAVYFDNVTNAPSYTVWITFEVDMLGPTALHQFGGPGGIDYVETRGSFNGWNTSTTGGVTMTNVPGTTNYVGTFTATNLTLGTAISYKYVIDGQDGTWEGGADRTFTLSVTNQTVGLDYFNNETNVPPSYTVWFQVNVAVEAALGLLVSPIAVAGDWDWTAGDNTLSQSANPYVYTGAVVMAFAPGATVNYKYNMDDGAYAYDWETNGVGPAGANNRQFAWPNTATNLALDYYDNLTDLGPVYINQTGGQTVLTWPYGTNVNNTIRLQSKTNLLDSAWTDVPGTQGMGAATNTSSSSTLFFRLIGP